MTVDTRTTIHFKSTAILSIGIKPIMAFNHCCIFVSHSNFFPINMIEKSFRSNYFENLLCATSYRLFVSVNIFLRSVVFLQRQLISQIVRILYQSFLLSSTTFGMFFTSRKTTSFKSADRFS